jgi:hypothetical protein
VYNDQTAAMTNTSTFQPMVKIIEVGPDSHLAKLHKHSTNLHYYGVDAKSVEGIFGYILLCQHGRRDLAEESLTIKRIQNNPCQIRPWIGSKKVVSCVDFQIAAPHIYRDILYEQLNQPASPFRAAFIKEIQDVPNKKIDFVVYSSNKDMVYTVGFSKRDYANVLPDDPSIGFNFYGDHLSKMAKMYRCGKPVPAPTFGGSLVNSRLFMQRSYTRTVLIVSDSIPRNVKSIQGGYRVSVSGGRYADIAEELEYQWEHCGVHIAQFQFVIIVIGVNVIQRESERENIASINPIGNLLIDEARKRTSKDIIFSTPFNHPTVPDARRHVEAVQNYFAGENIHVMSWFERDNPFIDANGELEMAYSDFKDYFHLSHRGFRLHWLEWCRLIPELMTINYKLSEDSKSVDSLRKRPRDPESGPCPYATTSGFQPPAKKPRFPSQAHRSAGVSRKSRDGRG